MPMAAKFLVLLCSLSASVAPAAETGIRVSNFEPQTTARSSWSVGSGGSNSADMAYILYQAPAMVAFHADDMLS